MFTRDACRNRVNCEPWGCCADHTHSAHGRSSSSVANGSPELPHRFNGYGSVLTGTALTPEQLRDYTADRIPGTTIPGFCMGPCIQTMWTHARPNYQGVTQLPDRNSVCCSGPFPASELPAAAQPAYTSPRCLASDKLEQEGGWAHAETRVTESFPGSPSPMGDRGQDAIRKLLGAPSIAQLHADLGDPGARLCYYCV